MRKNRFHKFTFAFWIYHRSGKEKYLDLKSWFWSSSQKSRLVFIHRRHGLIAKIKTAIATARNASKLRSAVYELMKNKRRTP